MVCHIIHIPVLGYILIKFLSEVTIGFNTDKYIIDENRGYVTVTCTTSGPVFANVTLNIQDSPNTAQSQLSIYYDISYMTSTIRT